MDNLHSLFSISGFAFNRVSSVAASILSNFVKLVEGRERIFSIVARQDSVRRIQERRWHPSLCGIRELGVNYTCTE